MEAVQRFWLPAFAFSAWMATAVMAFLAFNVKLDADATDSYVVVGWTGIGTAVVYAWLLLLPKIYTGLARPRFWFWLAAASAVFIYLGCQIYFFKQKDWVCEYAGVLLVKGDTPLPCDVLAEGTAGQFAPYFQGQEELRDRRFHWLAFIYSSLWLLLATLLVSMFHASRFKLRKSGQVAAKPDLAAEKKPAA